MDALDRANASTSVIIVSNNTCASLRGEARAHGAVAFVEKPVRPEALESVLRACNLFDSRSFNSDSFDHTVLEAEAMF